MPTIKEILESMDYGLSPEASDQAREWLTARAAGFGHFIGGQFTSTSEAKMFEVRDPARDVSLGKVSQGRAADIDAAVAAAQAALPGWSAIPGHIRARHLYALARHIQKR